VVFTATDRRPQSREELLASACPREDIVRTGLKGPGDFSRITFVGEGDDRKMASHAQGAEELNSAGSSGQIEHRCIGALVEQHSERVGPITGLGYLQPRPGQPHRKAQSRVTIAVDQQGEAHAAPPASTLPAAR